MPPMQRYLTERTIGIRLSKLTPDAPLLYVGDDFSKTDLESAL
jgi:hypothetical protein